MWATSTVFEVTRSPRATRRLVGASRRVGDVVEAPSNPLEGDVYEGDVVGAKRVTVIGEGDSTRWVIVSTEANGELSFEDVGDSSSHESDNGRDAVVEHGAVPISLEEDTLWYLIPAAE